jgi:hypothetical protein
MSQRYNALKHGLYAQEVCLPFEDRRKYLRFRREYMHSLDPQDQVQEHQAGQLADQAWIFKRLNQSLLAHQQKIYDLLKPRDLAAILNIPNEVKESPPAWLTDMNHRIPRPLAQFALKVCQQYQDCLENFAKVPNLGVVCNRYPQLFEAASQYAISQGNPEIMSPVTGKMSAVWQAAQNQTALWGSLKITYVKAYYQAYWKELQPALQVWVESWYFIQESQDGRVQKEKSLTMKAHQDFRKQMQAYQALKKEARLTAVTTQAKEVSSSPRSSSMALAVSGVGARLEIGQCEVVIENGLVH